MKSRLILLLAVTVTSLVFGFSSGHNFVSADDKNFTIASGRSPVDALTHLPNLNDVLNLVPILWPEDPGISQHGNINVDGNALFSGTITATAFVGDGSGLTGISGGGSGDGHSLDAADGSPTDALYVDNNGKVGIGTTTPQRLLHISLNDSTGASPFILETSTDSFNPNLEIKDNSPSQGRTPSIQFGNNTNFPSGRIDYSPANNFMKFDTNSVERLRIDSSGNIGIGTTAPKKKLDVSGDIYISNTGSNMIMKSPDGSCSSCGPDNSDVWSCTSITCP